MLSAQGKNGLLAAWEAKPSDGPFLCPGCKQGAILKKGHIKTHHFAHAPGELCPYWEYHQGESQVHLGAKKAIYEALAAHPQVSRLQLERYMGSVRPDVSFFLGDVPIAIEMQVSSIQLDTIARRTKEYTRRGVSILWISPYEETSMKEGKPYTLRAWERYIHNLYGKTFYYWASGETLYPVHFDEYKPPVREKPYQPAIMHLPSRQESVLITALEATSFAADFIGDTSRREIKFWCIPRIWVPEEGVYLPIQEAQRRYPFAYPDPRSLRKPLDEIPFSGDPFNETPLSAYEKGMLSNAPGGSCPIHKRLYRFIDEFGTPYCSDIECWSRFRLMQIGSERGYPELNAIVDTRDYLPDLTAEPSYHPTPLGNQLVPVYPTRPPRQTVLIRAGEMHWRTYVADQHYVYIGQALTAVAMC